MILGRLIVFDGLDGSGKETQSELLYDFLKKEGTEVRTISFPCYGSVSSQFVRMYLDGTLGMKPSDNSAYAASTFFAVDRYIFFKTARPEELDKDGAVVIANRYTTANAVHQLTKLPRSEWDGFLNWLWDYEYDKLQIPKPDDIVYHEMHPDVSIKLIQQRSSETGRFVDIHEADKDHLYKAYEAAIYASDKLGWNRIRCFDGDEPLTRSEIHENIKKALKFTD